MSRCQLYAILDVDACSARALPPYDAGEALAAAAPAILQLRAKELPAEDTLRLLSALRAWTRPHGTQLFMNDRADLAELAGCEGVHVGQKDLPILSVRHHFPRLRVGVSTHSEAEFEHALAARPDYVAIGPVFTTGSKRESEAAIGLDLLARLAPRARARGIPVVAIGGIDRTRAPSVVPHADYVAAIAALLPGEGGFGDARSRTQGIRALARAYEGALALSSHWARGDAGLG